MEFAVYPVYLLPVAILTALAVFFRSAVLTRRKKLEELKCFLTGERTDDFATYVAIFFNFSSAVFSGVWRGIKFKIEVDSISPSSRGGMRFNLVFPVDITICITASSSGFRLSGSDFGDMRDIRPGLWAEKYTIRTDAALTAAEYLSAESVQQAIKGLVEAGYDIRIGLSSVTASHYISPWKRPNETETELLSKEKLCPAIDALAVLTLACGRIPASPPFC